MEAASPSNQLHPSECRSVSAPDGVRLEYEVLGEGPPLLLLHGGFAGRSTFSRQRSLAARYRLVMPSSRGHDGTDNTLSPAFGFDTTEVDDVLAVMRAEGIDRTHILGHSSGGATAFAFACRFPDRVHRLVLIEPTLLPLLNDHDRERIVRLFQSMIARGEQEGPAAALRAVIDWSGGEAWRKLDEFAKAGRIGALAPLAPLVVPHGRALMNFKPSLDDARGLTTPTLLIYGTASFDPHPAICRRWRELRPDLQIIIADGAGHNVHRDRPDLVNTASEEFLKT